MDLAVKIYDTSQQHELINFCNECKKIGYKNNESLKKLKLDRVKYSCIYDKHS